MNPPSHEPDHAASEATSHAPPTTRPPGSTGRRLPTTAEEWEQLRRSVAMLSPGAWALKREPALAALDLLVSRLRISGLDE